MVSELNFLGSTLQSDRDRNAEMKKRTHAVWVDQLEDYVRGPMLEQKPTEETGRDKDTDV